MTQPLSNSSQTAIPEAWTAGMLAASLDAILVIDESGLIKSWGVAAEKMFHYTADDALGHAFFEVLLPERHRKIAKQWAFQCTHEVHRLYSSPAFQLTAQRADQSEFSAEMALTPIEHCPEIFAMTIRMLPEQLQSDQGREEIELRLQRELLIRRLVGLMNQSLDTHFIMQTASREVCLFLEADRAFVNLMHWDEKTNALNLVLTTNYCASEDILPFSDEDVETVFKAFSHIPPEALVKLLQPATLQPEVQTMEQLAEYTISTFNLTPLDIEKMIEITLKYQILADLRATIQYKGKPMGQIVVQQCKYRRNWQADEIDFLNFVAEQLGIALAQAELYESEHNARQQAEIANRKKSEFLAMMSHELRTPLNAIIGYSQMMKMGMGGPVSEKQTKYLGNVERSGTHLLGIVNSLLDVSQIEAGKLVVVPEMFELQPVLEEARSLVEAMADQKKVSLNFEIQPDLQALEADPSRFKQILVNLLSNAIKFNHPHGYVVLRLHQSEDRNWLIGEVEDNGIGIPEDKQVELFNKFYQVDSRMARQHEGTGLGLALTKDLIELHGGRISVESREGEGAKFIFQIPFHRVDSARAKSETA